MNDRFSHLKERLDTLPIDPGVYQMRDGQGAILYIGKAKNLRNRVRSYFRGSALHSPRIAIMVGKVQSIDLVVTGSEMEALLLEDNMIKEEQPPYNVLLKDDKNYPYLKLTMKERYPRLLLVRKVRDDGGAYFGPYVSAKSVRSTMRLIHRIFPLRQSRDSLEGKPLRRPCLNHQMGRCLAPCAGRTTEEEYAAVVEQVTLFLKGKSDELITGLEELMWQASERESFELAARRRDQLAAIKGLNEKQNVSQTRLEEEDVIAIQEKGGKSIIKIFQVRRGKMSGERRFMFEALERLDRAEALGAFIRQFYSEGSVPPPKRIIVAEEPDDSAPLQERLAALRGGSVTIEAPKMGRKKKLLDLAERNAALQLATTVESSEGKERGLEEIRDILGLGERPERMEAYDISNTSGVLSVGSVVTMTNGEPDRAGYRKYRIKSVSGPDDCASLAEVIERRFSKIAKEGGAMADLLVIDGGKGQLSAVLAAFARIDVEPPPIIGIAKGSDRENPETDLILRPGHADPAPFPPSSPGKFMLLRLRDEAHRFAISYHQKLRNRAMRKSALDDIPGVGPKRKKALLRKFGSVKKIREASVEEIAGAINVSPTLARTIHEAL